MAAAAEGLAQESKLRMVELIHSSFVAGAAYTHGGDMVDQMNEHVQDLINDINPQQQSEDAVVFDEDARNQLVTLAGHGGIGFTRVQASNDASASN